MSLCDVMHFAGLVSTKFSEKKNKINFLGTLRHFVINFVK